jgi:hypothetical protein
MSASTRWRVSNETSARPLMTLETVGDETPASAAMCAMVVDWRPPDRRDAGLDVMVEV